MYSVYTHTTPSGKIYVGITQQNVERRWQRGYGYINNSYFMRAINKYGWDNLTHEVIASGLSKEEACELEKELIAKYKSNDREYGYNISIGGDLGHKGCKASDESRERMSRAHMGEKNQNYGKHFSEEHKRKLAASHLGRKFSEEHIRNLSIAKTNPSEETRKKMRDKKRIYKSVLCLETGKVYSDPYVAAEEIGTHHRNVLKSCRSGTTTCGLHFKYTEQANTEVSA